MKAVTVIRLNPGVTGITYFNTFLFLWSLCEQERVVPVRPLHPQEAVGGVTDTGW